MTLPFLVAAACGDLSTSSGPAALLQQMPPSARITGTVLLDGAPVSDWTVELTGWLDAQFTASTPLGARTTDANGRYLFSVQPEAHHCGRMSAKAAPPSTSGTAVVPLSPDKGVYYPIQCGTTDSLDFRFATRP